MLGSIYLQDKIKSPFQQMVLNPLAFIEHSKLSCDDRLSVSIMMENDGDMMDFDQFMYA